VKQIVAIVKPYLAEKVLESLKRAPLEAVSVREVKGYGRQKSYLDQYGDSEYSLAFLPKDRVMISSKLTMPKAFVAGKGGKKRH